MTQQIVYKNIRKQTTVATSTAEVDAVNFITAMPDVNYAVSVSAGSTVNASYIAGLGSSASPPNMLVGSFNMTTVNGAGELTDQLVICASVFR